MLTSALTAADRRALLPESGAKNSGNEEAGYPVQMLGDLHDISRQQLIVGGNQAGYSWIAFRWRPPSEEDQSAPAAHRNKHHYADGKYRDGSAIAIGRRIANLARHQQVEIIITRMNSTRIGRRGRVRMQHFPFLVSHPVRFVHHLVTRLPDR